MQTTSLIDEFFSQKRFAMVGVSRDSRDFSRALFREFIQRGCDVVPVNPQTADLDGKKTYASVKEVSPPVTSALLMTSERITQSILDECVEAGITLVWIYGIVGPKNVNPYILKYCEAHGMGVIPGYCPFMFLPGADTYHRFHRWAWKLLGYYPNDGRTTTEHAQ